MSLKFYSEERLIFSEAFKELVETPSKAKMITNRIARHFKVKNIKEVKVAGRRNCCTYWSGTKDCRINLSKNRITIGIIAHEVCHAWQVQKDGRSFHGNKLMRLLARTLKYAKKKNYWRQEKEIMINGEQDKEVKEDWIDGDRLTCIKCDNFVTEIDSNGLCLICRQEESL